MFYTLPKIPAIMIIVEEEVKGAFIMYRDYNYDRKWAIFICFTYLAIIVAVFYHELTFYGWI